MMMEIKDSRGRKVSLLNDDLPRLSNLAASKPATALPPLLQHRPHSYFSGKHHASDSSQQSTPSSSNSSSSSSSRSPPPSSLSNAPSLCRSDSSDSAALNPPSPPTPLSSGFEHLRQALPNRRKSQIDGLPGIDSLARRPSSISSSHHHHHTHRPLLHHHPYSTTSSHRHRLSSGASRSPMDFPHTPLGAAAADFGFPSTTTLAGTPTFDALAPLPTSSAALSAQQALPNPAVFEPSLSLNSVQPFGAAPVAPLPQQQQPAQPRPPQHQQQQQSQRPQKKNSYPCPLSKQYNCGEFFTTSGHAARHAKKHTGKKDAICPECGKGFTRKDNMEQHRRTHANGRNAHNNHHGSTSSSSSTGSAAPSTTSSTSSNGKSVPKAADTDEAKARKKVQQQRKARPSSISTSAPAPISAPQLAPSHSQPSTATSAVPPTMDLLDPALRPEQVGFGFSPTSGSFDNLYPFSTTGGVTLDGGLAFHAPHAPMRASAYSQANVSRMRQETHGNDESQMARPRPGPTSPSLAPKLDALALVAEGVRRRDSDSSR